MVAHHHQPDVTQEHPDARPDRVDFYAEPALPDLKPGQGRICVAVDFGTVLSGVACGVSSNTVEQILWPGSNRKVPTCIVYDAKGHVVAWGHRALVINLEKDWTRCEMYFDYISILPLKLICNIGSNFTWILPAPRIISSKLFLYAS